MKSLENNKLIVGLIIGGLVACVGFVAFYAHIAFGAPAVRDANNIPAVLGSSCDTATATQVAINNSASTVLQATTTKRALLRITQPLNATNTVAIAINGAAAVAGTGIILSPATTTNAAPTTIKDFGLTTSFPYTGSISAITSTGGAIVDVVTCTYETP